MARTQTMVQLTSELVEQLELEARRRSCSRSAIIREAIAEHLARTSLDAAVGRYVASYRQHPQMDIDEWGDLNQQSARSGRAAARALAAEEEAAGLSW